MQQVSASRREAESYNRRHRRPSGELFIAPRLMRGVDRLYSGGVPIAPAVVEGFAQRFGRSIRSSYGMTELTAPSHLAPAEGPIPVDPQSGALSVGIPPPGTDVIVVNDSRRPLGPGEHGEIFVRGPAVMAGYWRKPVETGEVLVGRWMHTGDIGFFDETGWFYLVDRKEGHDLRFRLQDVAAGSRRCALCVPRRS
jgi:acyl-CoA synthetase (AMP-forming)/AMP-acid ligase II